MADGEHAGPVVDAPQLGVDESLKVPQRGGLVDEHDPSGGHAVPPPRVGGELAGCDPAGGAPSPVGQRPRSRLGAMVCTLPTVGESRGAGYGNRRDRRSTNWWRVVDVRARARRRGPRYSRLRRQYRTTPGPPGLVA